MYCTYGACICRLNLQDATNAQDIEVIPPSTGNGLASSNPVQV